MSTTLRQIIDYSKQNPDSDYAKRAAFLMKRGDFDQQATQEGIDLSFASRPSPAPQPNYLERVRETQEAGAEMAGEAEAQGGANVVKDFQRLQDEKTGNPALDALRMLVFAGHTAGNIAGTTIGIGMGAAKAAVAPISQIKTPEGDTIGERFATPIKEDFAAAVKKVDETHPEIAQKWNSLTPDERQSLTDILLTTGLLGGGAGRTLGTPVTAEAIPAVKTGLETAASTPVRVAAGATDKTKEAMAKTTALAAGATAKAKELVRSPFQETYLAHSLRTKTTNNVLKASTFTKTDAAGNKVTTSPLDTLEQFTSRPKVESTPNGYKLNTESWQEEAAAKQMAFDKQVTKVASGKPKYIPVANLRAKAFEEAAKDTELTDSPAREIAVQNELKALFEVYGGKEATIDTATLNRFRIGANKEAKAYYDAQSAANVKGVPPRISADTAKAYEIMAGVFRDQLAKALPEVDGLLAQERAMINANRYATQIHLSTVGPSMMGKSSAEIAAYLIASVTPGGPLAGLGAAYSAEKVAKYMTEQKFANYQTFNARPKSPTKITPKMNSIPPKSSTPGESVKPQITAQNLPRSGIVKIYRGESEGTKGGNFFTFDKKRAQGFGPDVIEEKLNLDSPNVLDLTNPKLELDKTISSEMQQAAIAAMNKGASVSDEVAFQPFWDRGYRALIIRDHMDGKLNILLNPNRPKIEPIPKAGGATPKLDLNDQRGFIANPLVHSEDALKKTFDEFRALPKDARIERATDLVQTPYELSPDVRNITKASGEVSFTRRTLKHLAEKGDEGERLMKQIPEILKTPDEIRQGDVAHRFFITKSIADVKKGRPHTVYLEVTEQKGDIIVTSFQTDPGYLADYELLWKAAGQPKI